MWQLNSNISRLRPDLAPVAAHRVTRLGMRSYLRYFAEAFRLPGLPERHIDTRVRVINADVVRADISAGTSVVLALGHNGNWDLAGAWAARHIAPVLTVAEKLPDGLYEEFVQFRNSIGIEIVPLEGGTTFRSLLRRVSEQPWVIPLLADRDLTAHGIEVDLAGTQARVAAGPAALARAKDLPLVATAIYYERLTGARRRAAASPWGLVIEFIPVPTTNADGEQRSVPELTQAWVDALFGAMARTPQDWHMLQKVFVSDLDPERLRAAEEKRVA